MDETTVPDPVEEEFKSHSLVISRVAKRQTAISTVTDLGNFLALEP